MNTATLRERLNSKIDDLTDEQVTSVWHYTEALLVERLPDDYDPDNDLTIGFFPASPKEILRDEFGQ